REQHLALGRAPLAPFVRWFLSRLATAVVLVNYEFADQVSPVCKHHMRWEQWLGVESSRIRVIYNGVDPLSSRGVARQAAPPTVVTAGPISATSGHIDLIEAAALVRRAIPNVRFRLPESGDEADILQCRDLVRGLGLEETVFFEDGSRASLDTLQEAHVFALPTVSDSFPHALVHAMLSELGIVATNIGGIPEAVGETALLVPPGDPAAMADSIATLLRSPDSSRCLGQHA